MQYNSRPSSNVMLEYGLFLGCLGRPRVAIARVEGAHLPSDISGVNYIRLPKMEGSSANASYESFHARPPVLAWLNQLSEAPDLRERISRHLQALYNRSERLCVIIPRLRDGTGSDPGLLSANISKITTMTTVEGMAFGWLLKAFSPMMRAKERIDCSTPSREYMFTQGSATFVIGSPSTNEQTRSNIDKWYHADMTTEATQDYSDIITYKGEEFGTQFVNGMRTRDFSFLIYRSRDELFVCAGTSPFGTAGAVSMLTEPNKGKGVEPIYEYINNRQSFVAIGEVDVFSETSWSFSKVLSISPEANGAGDSE